MLTFIKIQSEPFRSFLEMIRFLMVKGKEELFLAGAEAIFVNHFIWLTALFLWIITIFFLKHSYSTVHQGGWRIIFYSSLENPPVQKSWQANQAITSESSPQHAISGWLQTGYYWYPCSDPYAYGNIFVNQQLNWEANYKFKLWCFWHTL